MTERTGLVTMRGNPLTLLGQEPQVGSRAPDVDLVDRELNTTALSSFWGKVTILLSVPSLDTQVCDKEGRRFNEEVGKFQDSLQCIVVSMDLPFAQKRWCGNAGIHNVIPLSDYRESGFGKTYGVLIKELRFLARAIFIVDQSGILRFKDLVHEITEEPDYNQILHEAQKYFVNV